MFGCHPNGPVEGDERRVLNALPASDDPIRLTPGQVAAHLPDLDAAFVNQLLWRLRDRGLARHDWSRRWART